MLGSLVRSTQHGTRTLPNSAKASEMKRWLRIAPVVSILAVGALLACNKHLSAQISVEQRREVIYCLERQGYRPANDSSPACRDAVWAALVEVEANAGCEADSDCFVFPMLESEGPCWHVSSRSWLEVHPRTGSLSRIVDACGHVDGICIPETPPQAYCDAGRCRMRDYPLPMVVPHDFSCPEAGLR